MSKHTWIISALLATSVGVVIGNWAWMKNHEDSPFSPTQRPLAANSAPEVLEETDSDESVNLAAMTNPVEWQISGSEYTAELDYSSPAGDELNTLSLTLEDGTVTEFEMTIETKNPTSIRYQREFIEELEPMVIGKSIAELAGIDTIAGASLTTDAFTNAVAQVGK